MDKLYTGLFTRKIKYVSGLKQNDIEVMGCLRYENDYLEIEKNMSLYHKAMILAHEAAHDYDNQMGMGLNESNIQRMGVAMIDFIQKNPKIVSVLQKRGKA